MSQEPPSPNDAETSAPADAVRVAAELAPAAPLAADWSPGPRFTRNDAVAVAGALLIHAFVAQAFVERPPMRLGAGGLDQDAIDVDIIDDGTLLRSDRRLARPGAAPDSAAALQTGGEASAESKAAAAGSGRTGETADQPVRPDEVASEVRETPEDNAVEAAAPEPVRPAESESPSRGALAEAVAALEGGITVASRMAGQTDDGRTAAAKGEQQRYAAEVMRRLAQNMPRLSAPASGVVRVSFAIDETGRVSEARVVRSSGDPRLDQLALSSVRSTTFTAPPVAMREGERRYEIPYIFR